MDKVRRVGWERITTRKLTLRDISKSRYLAFRSAVWWNDDGPSFTTQFHVHLDSHFRSDGHGLFGGIKITHSLVFGNKKELRPNTGSQLTLVQSYLPRIF